LSTDFHLICDTCNKQAYVCNNHGYFNDEELKLLLLEHRWNCNGKLSLVSEDQIDIGEEMFKKMDAQIYSAIQEQASKVESILRELIAILPDYTISHLGYSQENRSFPVIIQLTQTQHHEKLKNITLENNNKAKILSEQIYNLIKEHIENSQEK